MKNIKLPKNKKIKTPSIKSILTVIGGILFTLALGSVYVWAFINPYFVSYLKNHSSPNIQIVDGYFLMPLTTFISNIVSFLGPSLEDKYGIKTCLLIASSLIITSHLILLFSTYLPLIYLSMIIFGVAISCSYLSILKNCWSFFPEHKGKVGGIILLGYGLSGFCFTFLSDYIINPQMLKINSETGFFDKSIAENVHTFIFVFTIILSIMAVLGYLFTFDYKQISKSAKEHLSNVTSSMKENLNEKISHEIHGGLTLIEILKCKQSWEIVGMSFFTLYFCYMATNTNRAFGQMNMLDEGILSAASKMSSLLNGGSRLMWGFLFDKFGFKKPFMVLVIVEIVVSGMFYFVGTNTVLYFLMVSLTALILAGVICLTTPLYPKIFGLKNGPFVNGICIALYGFSCLLGPIVAKFIIKKKSDYKVLYLSGMVFACIGLLLTMKFNEEPITIKSNLREKMKGKYEDLKEKGKEMLLKVSNKDDDI